MTRFKRTSDNDPDDMTAGEMAERRRQAMERAAGEPPAPPAPQPPAPPASGQGLRPGGSWKLPVDLGQTTEQAKHQEREHRADLHAALGQDADKQWQTRSEKKLIEVDEGGTPVVPERRSIDVERAEEYGPLSVHAIEVINRYFANADVGEIHLNAPDAIFAKVRGERVKVSAAFSNEEEYNRFIEDLIRSANTYKTFEEIRRRAGDVIQLAGGDRMLVWFPPHTDCMKAAIHKITTRAWDMQKLVQNGTLTPNMAMFLKAAVRARANIMVCGELGAGKSVMLSTLAQEIAENERVVIMEEVAEIYLTQPDVTRVTYYPTTVNSDTDMGLHRALSKSLLGRYDRLMVSELHSEGGFQMLRMMSTGGDGSMSTFHAGTAEQALEQLRNIVILENPQLPAYVAASIIRSALNIIVIMERVDGKHRVKEIIEVEWRNVSDKSETIGRNLLFNYERGAKNPETGARAEGRFVSPGRLDENGKIVEKAEKYGVPMKREWFGGEDFMRAAY